MSNDRPLQVSEEMLHGYVDGQLSARDRQRVESYLADNPDRAQQVADWTRQNAALEALFPAAQAEQHLRHLALPTAVPPARAAWPVVVRLAAVLAILGLGVAGGWFARDSADRGAPVFQADLVREAIMAHSVFASEVLHPVEVTAANESHLVGWLSKRLGARIVAPDLSASGFDLIGGRLLPADDGPAAQFMYEDADGRRITIYATGGSPGVLASFQFDKEGAISGIYWQDESLRYAVVGTLSRDELTALATEVYRQLI
jgi:anti-sigma factor RsiW